MGGLEQPTCVLSGRWRQEVRNRGVSQAVLTGGALAAPWPQASLSDAGIAAASACLLVAGDSVCGRFLAESISTPVTGLGPT